MTEGNLRVRLQADLRTAMRERDAARVSVLRNSIAALGNAEAVRPEAVRVAEGVFAAEVARRELTPADEAEVLGALRAEYVTAADERRDLGRPEDAEVLDRQASLLATYLA